MKQRKKNFDKESIKNVIVITLSLCFVASLLVSFTAISLKGLQERNKIIEKKKNILEAAGIIKAGQNISFEELEKEFAHVTTKLIDFESGEIITGENGNDYDSIKASKNLEQSIGLSKEEDIPSIKRREKKGVVYEVIKNDQIETIILPIRGYGLWSTLYGFLALDGTGKVVKGITFYEHAETPGLGGEVDNLKWKKSWENKVAYGDNGEVVIKVLKGGKANHHSKFEIDGLSGATITTQGVNAMIQFWLGEKKGFGRYLKKNVFEQ